jgi:hypothetical protein
MREIDQPAVEVFHLDFALLKTEQNLFGFGEALHLFVHHLAAEVIAETKRFCEGFLVLA